MPADPPVPRGKIAFPVWGWAQLPGIRYPLTNGVAVVSASAKINVKTAEQLRMALLEADRRGDATVVVDMTRTRFCHPAGLSVLTEAHRRALAEGGGLRLVIPVGGAVARLLYLTGLDCFIPSFGSLEGALASGCPRPSPGPHSVPCQPGSPDGRA